MLQLCWVFFYSGATAAISVIAALYGIGSQASVDWARGQIDYMLGNNPLGISYQIKEAALGWSPRKPHHRGALVILFNPICFCYSLKLNALRTRIHKLNKRYPSF